jgi:signal transduction histidine kinase
MLGAEEPKHIDVGWALREAVSLASDLKGIRISNECSGLTVLADSLLRELFHNLIDNTLKYGKKISQIRVSYEDRGGQLKLVFEDDGVGIPSEMKPKLFTRGFGKGTGLGLFLIKKIVEFYGWQVEEAGTEGKGARVDTKTWEIKYLTVKLADNAANRLGMKKRFGSPTISIPVSMIKAVGELVTVDKSLEELENAKEIVEYKE